jgi:hypothetical protein
MKNIIILVLLLISNCIHSNAQESKRNNNWSFGYAPVVIFNFNTGLSIDTLQQINGLKSSSCISNANGVFQFYSTGFGVVDRDGYLLSNGNFINCPKGNVLANYYGGASLFDQTSIILPKKGNTYYVFSTGMSDSAANKYLNQIADEFDVLNYSVVDMDSNNGKGKVVRKNVVLADNQEYVDCALHAVKHTNGKDWWLIKADCHNNRFQEYIVREDTILGPYYQEVPIDKVGGFCPWQSEIVFSEDGTKMASTMYGNIDTIAVGNYFYDFNRVDLFDFDRCDGSLIYKQQYRVPFDTNSYPNVNVKRGICFSPNGKLLYMSCTYSVYQIDLEDTAILNALLIHGPDTSIADFAWYGSLGLAPNGKIYVGSFGAKSLSYIDKPNVKGLGCDFMPKGLNQPYTYLMSPPNMPNYGLGADSALLVGCEPVSIREFENLVMREWHVYPNPASTNFYIKSRKGKKKEMFNSVGQMVLSTKEDEIDVTKLAKGIYYLRCNNEVKKVVIE